MESAILDLARVAVRRAKKARRTERLRRALLALHKEITAALAALAPCASAPKPEAKKP